MRSVNSIKQHDTLLFEGQHGTHEGQHGAHRGQHGAHRGQHGAHEGQHGEAPCEKWLDETLSFDK